jgi:gluconate kinase
VVHSYDAEYVWCQALNQGLRAALRGLPVELEIVYLDAKHDLNQTACAPRYGCPCENP